MRSRTVITAFAWLLAVGCNSAPASDETADSEGPCSDLPCPVDADGHMSLKCICDIIDCPQQLDAAAFQDRHSTVVTHQCDGQTVVGISSGYYAEAFGYDDTGLVSAFVYDHGDGHNCLWHHSPDFPTMSDCDDACIVSSGDIVAEPGSCLDEEEIGAGGGPSIIR